MRMAALNAAADEVNPVEEQVCSVLVLMAAQMGCGPACSTCHHRSAGGGSDSPLLLASSVIYLQGMLAGGAHTL